MKKVALILPLLLLLLGVALPNTAIAHTEGDPFVTDLIAGGGNPASAIDVGDVLAWNDVDYLYVKYVTTDDWYLTEVHLQIATLLDGVPQMNGNPIPGQFDYVEEGLWTQEYLFEIPLIWDPCTDVYIAAHAAVVHVSSDCLLIVSDATAEWSADGTAWQPAVACWVHPSWNDIPGATWIWRTELTDPLWEYNNVPAGGWYFRKPFTLPSTAFGISASAVAANGDNAYTIALNGVPLVPGGDGVMDKDDPNHMGWQTVINHVIPTGTITPGSNELQLRAMNYYDWGDSYSNPAGLAFKVQVCYCYFDMEETAWGAGCDFPGKNWATYFTYHVQGWNVEGEWVIRVFWGGTYDHDFTFSAVQTGGTFTGTGGYPATGPPYSIIEDVTGTVSGNTITFHSEYQGSTYYWDAVGTIAPDGTMSGTWTSSTGQAGTWESISGQAVWE